MFYRYNKTINTTTKYSDGNYSALIGTFRDLCNIAESGIDLLIIQGMIRSKKILGAFDGIRWKSANIQAFPSLSHFYVFLSLPFFYLCWKWEMECLHHKWHQSSKNFSSATPNEQFLPETKTQKENRHVCT